MPYRMMSESNSDAKNTEVVGLLPKCKGRMHGSCRMAVTRQSTGLENVETFGNRL